jgi:hypothetical protein
VLEDVRGNVIETGTSAGSRKALFDVADALAVNV